MSARSGWTHTSSAARCATTCSGTTPRMRTSSFPACDIEGLRAALAPHGRAEELVVAGRPVGVRFHPRDPEVRKLVRAGIELAPPRREVSTGPGRHDFEIVVDPTATVEDDLAPPGLHRERHGTPARRRDARRSPPWPRRSRGPDAADRLAGQLRRGSAAARSRSPVRLAARPEPRRGDASADARGGGERRARLG